ncbi:MAG: hypothetical protein PF443_00455 [Allgaiera sp.]|jgi:hypothetical protein|nr:hypothetical protein [Allgaiera sp.]
MRRLLLSLLMLVSLSACGAESLWAPNAEVARFRYSAPGPRTLTLITVINNRSGEGGHSALMVNDTQRVMFDPAGTWTNPQAPERNDVHFGMTPAVLDNFLDYHTRITWHTVEQTVVVSPQIADEALKLVETNGAVPKAMCADNTSKILRQLPGFQSLPQTFFPVTLMDAFAKLPGVKTRVYYDTDPDVNTEKLEPVNPVRPRVDG